MGRQSTTFACFVVALLAVNADADDLIIGKESECDISSKVDQYLRDGYNTINRVEGKAIVLVGSTGGGKSTLSKFVRRDSSLRIDTIDWSHVFVDGDVSIGSADSFSSKTLKPNVDVDSESGVQMIDCAGFSDTRSPSHDLVVAFLNKLTLESVENLKIILVEDWNNVRSNSQRDSFMKSLRHLSKLISSNAGNLQGSFGLVTTKVETNTKDSFVVMGIGAFLNRALIKLEERRKEAEGKGLATQVADFGIQMLIVQNLLEGNGSKVAIFRRPDETGDPWTLKSLHVNYLRLRRVIFDQVTFSKLLTPNFHVTVSAETLDYIKEHFLVETSQLERNMTSDLHDLLKQRFDERVNYASGPFGTKVTKLKEYCDNYKSSVEGIDSFSQLQAFVLNRFDSEDEKMVDLRFLVIKRQFLDDVVGRAKQDFDDVREFNKYNSFLLSHVEKSAKHFEYFKQLVNASGSYPFQNALAEAIDGGKPMPQYFFSNLPLFGIEGAFNSSLDLPSVFVHGFAAEYLNVITRDTIRNSVQTFEGRFVTLSKIKDQIQVGAVDTVMIMATIKLFIDCDLVLRNTHLVLVAPLMEVVRNPRSIQMIGEDAPAPSAKPVKSTVRGTKGTSGLEGSDSFSSGSVEIIALAIRKAHMLTVTTEGGQGGNGQEGGDGYDAIPRPAPDFKYFKYNRVNDNVNTFITDAGYSHYYRFSGYLSSGMSGAYARLTGLGNYAKPTDGGKGGDAGLGRAPGAVTIKLKAISAITTNLIAKTHGLAGNGGAAGKNSADCLQAHYQCAMYGTSNICNWYDTTKCETKYINATDGSIGDSINGPMLHRYMKNQPSTPAHLKFAQIIQDENSKGVRISESAKELLSFIADTVKSFTRIDIQHYLTFLKESNELTWGFDGSLENGKQTSKYCLKTLHETFKKTHQTCLNCDVAALNLIDIAFSSQLDAIDEMVNKQIYKLATIVDKYLDDINDVSNYLVEEGKFHTAKSEMDLISSNIDAAGRMIKEFYERKFPKFEKYLDDKLKELVAKTVEMKSDVRNNVDKLNAMKTQVASAMLLKAALGCVNVVGLVGSVLWPPAAVLAVAATGVGAGLISSDTNYQKYKPTIAMGIQNANEVLKRFEESDLLQQLQIRKVLGAELELGSFVSEKNRELATAAMKPNSNIGSVNFRLVIGALGDDVQARITKLKDENGIGSDIKRLESLKSGLQSVVYLTGAAVEVVKLSEELASDVAALGVIESTIRENQVALNDLAMYEKVLREKFEPILKGMVATFKTFSSYSKHDNTFELQLRKFEVKTIARECISFVERFTEGFLRKDESLGAVLFDIQEFLTAIIDVYDKIQEYESRKRLTSFIGKMNGGQCSESLTSDPETCHLYTRVSAEIESKRLLGTFLKINVAYTKVMFPYGGQQLKALRSSLSRLSSTLNLPEKVAMLKMVLKTMKDRLADDDQMVNDEDKHISFAQFNAIHVSREPFYTWHGSKYESQLKAFLSGEKVAFVASVTSPKVRNAVKFKVIMLNVTSSNAKVEHDAQELLRHFEVTMTHGGESYYKCGSYFYSIPGERLVFKMAFERDLKGELVMLNKVASKLHYGDVPFSPYALWNFQLHCASQKQDCKSKFDRFSNLAKNVNLELVGSGYYLDDDAAICKTNLSDLYTSFGATIL